MSMNGEARCLGHATGFKTGASAGGTIANDSGEASAALDISINQAHHCSYQASSSSSLESRCHYCDNAPNVSDIGSAVSRLRNVRHDSASLVTNASTRVLRIGNADT